MINLKKFTADEQGSTSIMMTVMFPVFIGATLLATEVGYWQLHTSELQNTADMAAIAGAYEYIIDGDLRDSGLAAYADAIENEFDPEMGTITLNMPPTSGEYAGEDAVEIIMVQNYPSMISNLFKAKPIEKTVTAVAVLGGQTSQSCILSLNETDTGIAVGGSVNVNLSGCGLHSNSTSSQAIQTWGSVTVDAACMSAVGGISTGTATINLDDCAAPRENQREIDNPFADVEVPDSYYGLPCNTVQSGSGRWQTTTFPVPALTGGVARICDSQIDLAGTNVLSPGTYFFDGTEIDFGSHASLAGTGVTLIFANGGELQGLNGNNTLNITAPQGGDWDGMAIIADPDTMPNAEWNLGGNADLSIDGTVYLPNIDLRYAGGAGINATSCTQIVANTVLFTGNSGFQAQCDHYSSPTIVGGAFTTVSLVE